MTGWLRTVAIALSFALAAAAGCIAGAAPSFADGTLTVTWPDITELNPDLTSYDVDATYSGPGTLMVWTVTSGGNQTVDPLDADGTHTVRFPDGGYDGRTSVRLLVCPEATLSPTCTERGRSPDLTVFSHAFPTLPQAEAYSSHLGPNEAIPYLAWPLDELWDIAWEILPAEDPTAAPLVSGSVTGVRSSLAALPPAGPTDALVSGEAYVVRVHASTDTASYGHLEGEGQNTFTWDAHAPDMTLFVGHSTGDPDYTMINDDVFYPVKDGYQDVVYAAGMVPDENETVAADLVITDATGAAVYRAESRYDGEPGFGWDGHDEDGRLLPEGRYDVTMTAYDVNDNAATQSRSIELSHARKRVELWRHTFAAAGTVIKKATEGCGRLVTPARRAWRGSLGYDVESHCNQPTVVATSNGAFVPRSPIGEYSGMRVTVNGSKGLGEKRAELVLYYLNRDGDWVARRRLDGDGSRHPGAWLGRHNGVLGKPRERPYAVWTVGLSKGWRYDVKSFTVEVKWVDFR